jgi:hypothetical protein
MSARISYTEISTEDRERLTAEAYRLKPRLRVARFAAVFVPIVFSRAIADRIFSMNGSFIKNLGLTIAVGVVLCFVIWEIFGRRQLKAKVEELVNA